MNAICILVLLLAGTLAPSVAAAPAAAQGVAAPVSANDGWTYVNAWFDAGQTFTVTTNDDGPDGKAGTWTVGYPGLPAVGPNGYDRSTDRTIYQGCKVVDRLPYGRLLGRFFGNDGNPVGPVFSVGAGGTFRANASGGLRMRINDQDRCLEDNQGYIEVWVM